MRGTLTYIACIFLMWPQTSVCQPPLPSTSPSAGEIDLGPSELKDLGDFLSEFLRRLNVHSACVSWSQSAFSLPHRILLTLSKRRIFTSICCFANKSSLGIDVPSSCRNNQSLQNETHWQALQRLQKLQSTVERSFSNRSTRNVAEVHQASSTDVKATTRLVRERYDVTGGDALQIIVGENLEIQQTVRRGLARWIVASYNKMNRSVTVNEMYSFQDNEEGLMVWMGEWTSARGLFLHHYPGEGLKDLLGHNLRLATFPYPPYVMLGRNCKRSNTLTSVNKLEEDDYVYHEPTCTSGPPSHCLTNEPYVGYLIDLIEILAENLNFTFSILLPRDQNDYIFGVGEADNYSGLVGRLLRQEAEIILASLTISNSRLEVIDFSSPVDNSVKNLYIRSNATHDHLGWGTYAMSFDVWTWLGICSLLFTTSITFWLLMKKEGDPPRDMMYLHDILFMFFGCIVQQGSPNTPFTLRGRVVFFLFWFTSVVLYASYTAVLTSYLTVSTESPPFTSLQGAVDTYPLWTVGITTGTPLQQLIKGARGEPYQTLASRLENKPNLIVASDFEGLDRVLAENFALFADTPAMTYMLRNNCYVREIPIELFQTYGHLGFMRNLPYAGVLNNEITKMSDSGVLSRLHKRWWGSRIPCEDLDTFTELGFSHTLTAFIILLVGIALAALFLLYEVFVARKVKNEKHVAGDKKG